MKTIIWLLLFCFLFFSACSPQRRLARLLEQHPELTVYDTVRFRDTVAIPAASADTLINLKQMTDTIFIEKDRLSVKLFRQHDTLYVEGNCRADTIYRELRIPVEKIKLVKTTTKTSPLFKILLAVAAVIIGALLFRVRRC